MPIIDLNQLCKVAGDISTSGIIFNMRNTKLKAICQLMKAQRVRHLTLHEPRRVVRASISSCFLVPVVRIPKSLQASFSTGTVSFPRVPLCTWVLSSSSDTSTLIFFSAPPLESAINSVTEKMFWQKNNQIFAVL